MFGKKHKLHRQNNKDSSNKIKGMKRYLIPAKRKQQQQQTN
jgi:hypothetical protein